MACVVVYERGMLVVHCLYTELISMTLYFVRAYHMAYGLLDPNCTCTCVVCWSVRAIWSCLLGIPGYMREFFPSS